MRRALEGVAMQALRLLPAEAAHRLSVRLLAMGESCIPEPKPDDAILHSEVFGLSFPNPVGLAAGYDKNAECARGILKLGFGFTECGTVTPRPQGGNPKPRLFRLMEDEAVINRMGFNNDGMERVAERLERFQAKWEPVRRSEERPNKHITGINIGANKDSIDRVADYVAGFERLAKLAHYCTANISSPNTPGLRGLQNRAELEALLARLTEARAKAGLRTPILLKIAPDLDEAALDDIADVCLKSGIEGIIVCNTTLGRENLKSPNAKEAGGMSGAPLFALSTKILREMRQRVGTRLVLVGAGGIASGADAYAKIRAGASLVQVYSALVYRGPSLVTDIKTELAALLKRDGFSRIADAVGADSPA